MKEPTVRISVDDMEKLGVEWRDYCDLTGFNLYALREGMDKSEMVDVPISLIKTP